MKVNGNHYHSIWYDKNLDQVKIIDQRLLPYEFKIITVETLEEFETAIKDMAVRGAPLIGATAASTVLFQKPLGEISTTPYGKSLIKKIHEQCRNFVLSKG